MKISITELQVLDVLWHESPLTVGQIIERVQRESDWHQNTIKTLLKRLVAKEAIERWKDGGRFFYSALVPREEVVATEANGLLERFFDGQMAPLIAHFADRKQLTQQDINEIEKILDDLKPKE